MTANVLFTECDKFDKSLLPNLDPEVLVLRSDSVPSLRATAKLLEGTHPHVVEYISVLRQPVSREVPRRSVYYWILTKSWVKKKNISIPYKYASGFFGGYIGSVRAFGMLKTREVVGVVIKLAQQFLSERPNITSFLQESRRLLDSKRDGFVKQKVRPLRAGTHRVVDIDRGVSDWCFIMQGARNSTLLKEDGSALNHIFYFVTKWLRLYDREPVYYWRMHAMPSPELLKELNVTINNV